MLLLLNHFSHVWLFWTVAHRPSVHRILHTGILKWVAMSYTRGSSQPRNRMCVSWKFWSHRFLHIKHKYPGKFQYYASPWQISQIMSQVFVPAWLFHSNSDPRSGSYPSTHVLSLLPHKVRLFRLMWYFFQTQKQLQCSLSVKMPFEILTTLSIPLWISNSSEDGNYPHSRFDCQTIL